MTDFTIYTKENCPHCQHAKRLLNAKGLTFVEIKVPDQADREMIQERVTNSGSPHIVRSVPQVFEGETYIGTLEMLKHRLEA